jgi:predicted RNA-binding protein Jag
MMIFKRLAELKETIRVDTQRIRGKTLNSLQELFDLAVCARLTRSGKNMRVILGVGGGRC